MVSFVYSITHTGVGYDEDVGWCFESRNVSRAGIARACDEETNACQKNQSTVVEALLNRGPNANKCRTDDGTTPLFIASFLWHSAIVEYYRTNVDD
jgi:hypothetical protein